MPRIEIIEKDETSAGVYAEATDVVYIPGFVDITQECLKDAAGNYIGIGLNKPTLFTSVKQFESLCGKRAATFTNDQTYSDVQTMTANGIIGFSNNATPFHRIMFNAGTSDPSYVMAKEYLNAGLNVLYERVNGDNEFVQLFKEPTNWKTEYTNYYREVDKYTLINDKSLWYSKVEDGTEIDTKANYYVAEFYGEGETKPNGDIEGIKSFSKYTPADGETTIDASKNIYVEVKQIYKLSYKENSKTAETVWVADQYYNDAEKVYDKTTFEGLSTGTKIYTKDYECISRENDNMLTMYQFNQVPDNEEWTNFYNTYYEYAGKTKELIPQHGTAPTFNTLEVFTEDDGINIKTMYSALEGVFNSESIDGLADKGNYSVKYLTSGGYPVYEYNNNSIVSKMIDLAVKRGDCVAFIDHTDHSDRDDNIDHKSSVYATVSDDQVFRANGEFATMFTPWASYNRVTVDRDDEGAIIKSSSVRMPGSYAYFTALGDSIRTNANWLAIAGSARGVVLNLASNGMTTNIPNGAADSMQPRDGVAVNAITNIKPYGYTIWGNRTLKNNGEKGNLTATSFLNVRNLISDVKKVAYKVARQLTFEQNNDILWVNFKALIAPTLDRMLSGYGISGYKIVRDTEHEKATEKATVCAKIILYPVYAVEDFYITIVLKDDEISVE